METTCIRCGEPFDTEEFDLDVCPKCEAELNRLDSDDYYRDDDLDSVDEGSYSDDSYNY